MIDPYKEIYERMYGKLSEKEQKWIKEYNANRKKVAASGGYWQTVEEEEDEQLSLPTSDEEYDKAVKDGFFQDRACVHKWETKVLFTSTYQQCKNCGKEKDD